MPKKTKRNQKPIGSDCVHCYLDEGIYCMVYFCKKKTLSTENRVLCEDGFTGLCPDYKKIKIQSKTT
jgi:hypothetical protein